MTWPAASAPVWPLTSTTRVEATLSAKRSSVVNRRTVGKEEKSSGLLAFSATISTARLIMMLEMKPTSSSIAGTGTTIRTTIIRVASGSTASRPALAQSRRFTSPLAIGSAPQLGEHQIGEARVARTRRRGRLAGAVERGEAQRPVLRRLAGRDRGRRLAAAELGRETVADLGQSTGGAVLVVEDRAVGARRRRYHRSGGGRRIGILRGEELGGAAGAEEMGEIEVDRLGWTAEMALEIVAIVGGEFGRHRRRRGGILAQVEDRLARRRIGDAIASVRPLLDRVGRPAEAVLGAVLLDRREPGL